MVSPFGGAASSRPSRTWRARPRRLPRARKRGRAARRAGTQTDRAGRRCRRPARSRTSRFRRLRSPRLVPPADAEPPELVDVQVVPDLRPVVVEVVGRVALRLARGVDRIHLAGTSVQRGTTTCLLESGRRRLGCPCGCLSSVPGTPHPRLNRRGRPAGSRKSATTGARYAHLARLGKGAIPPSTCACDTNVRHRKLRNRRVGVGIASSCRSRHWVTSGALPNTSNDAREPPART